MITGLRTSLRRFSQVTTPNEERPVVLVSAVWTTMLDEATGNYRGVTGKVE